MGFKMKERIKNLNLDFKGYIELLKDFEAVNKGEINDLSQQEEFLRLDIISQLNKLKRDFF